MSDNEGSSGDLAASPLKTYTEKFEELFPYYLSIGMTYEQYWEQDCSLVKFYRKADEIAIKRKNQEMWIQGAYVYEAICRVSPILHAFAKKGTHVMPYLEEPLAITEQQVENKKESDEKKNFDKAKVMMETFMKKHNKKFEGK